jgi:hypothetical protein
VQSCQSLALSRRHTYYIYIHIQEYISYCKKVDFTLSQFNEGNSASKKEEKKERLESATLSRYVLCYVYCVCIV